MFNLTFQGFASKKKNVFENQGLGSWMEEDSVVSYNNVVLTHKVKWMQRQILWYT